MTVFHGKYVGYLGVDMMIYEDESDGGELSWCAALCRDKSAL